MTTALKSMSLKRAGRVGTGVVPNSGMQAVGGMGRSNSGIQPQHCLDSKVVLSGWLDSRPSVV